MFHRILVAFDGSPHAEDALALALRLRDPSDGSLTLACVVPESPWHRQRRPATHVAEEVASMLSEAGSAARRRGSASGSGRRSLHRRPVA
jgi:nucleotide-binding universal stress UspA family protein